MIKPIIKSIISPAIIATVWILGSKELISFPEPVALILIGVIFIGLANIGKKKFKRN